MEEKCSQCGENLEPSREFCWEENEKDPWSCSCGCIKLCSDPCFIQYGFSSCKHSCVSEDLLVDRQTISLLQSRVGRRVSRIYHRIPENVTCQGASPLHSCPLIEGFSPLCLSSIQSLIELSEIAPMGKGERDVVDTSVRKVLQVDQKSGVVVTWEYLGNALDHAASTLCPGMQLQASFYKLLIYREGDFFDFHTDSKKSDDHLLTLVVDCGVPEDCGVPICEGGELHFISRLEFEKKQKAVSDVSEYKRLKTSRNISVVDRWKSRGKGDYCFWFASQPHRVTKVTKGYRVVALYNVTVRRGEGAAKTQANEPVAATVTAASSSDVPVATTTSYTTSAINRLLLTASKKRLAGFPPSGSPSSLASGPDDSGGRVKDRHSYSLQCSLWTLGPEILWLVVDQLPLVDFLSFVYTCKTAHLVFSGKTAITTKLLDRIKPLVKKCVKVSGMHSVGFVVEHKYSYDSKGHLDSSHLRGKDSVFAAALGKVFAADLGRSPFVLKTKLTVETVSAEMDEWAHYRVASAISMRSNHFVLERARGDDGGPATEPLAVKEKNEGTKSPLSPLNITKADLQVINESAGKPEDFLGYRVPLQGVFWLSCGDYIQHSVLPCRKPFREGEEVTTDANYYGNGCFLSVHWYTDSSLIVPVYEQRKDNNSWSVDMSYSYPHLMARSKLPLSEFKRHPVVVISS